jgi:hypothetical protein
VVKWRIRVPMMVAKVGESNSFPFLLCQRNRFLFCWICLAGSRTNKVNTGNKPFVLLPKLSFDCNGNHCRGSDFFSFMIFLWSLLFLFSWTSILAFLKLKSWFLLYSFHTQQFGNWGFLNYLHGHLEKKKNCSSLTNTGYFRSN